MKKIILFSCGLLLAGMLKAQFNQINSYVKSGIIQESQIGLTYYDLQTTASIQNRLVRWNDGSMAAVWTMSKQESGYSDRGTAYNYFNGTEWGASPENRLEGKRTGWPGIAKWGVNGEIVVSHNGEDGLEVMTRENKGEGEWNVSILSGPAASPKILFPKILTNGEDNNHIHILALADGEVEGVTPALLYFRSLDGGQTWDKQGVVIPGLDTSSNVGFVRDTYGWANAVGDTIAFVVASPWIDGIVMKSYDNGENWEKTLFFEHPYPKWTPDQLVDDKESIIVPDGSNSIVLDDSGKAHLFFGLINVFNDTVQGIVGVYHNDYSTLLYWNEALSLDSGKNVYSPLGGLIDLNENDNIDIITGGANTYNYNVMSQVSMPAAVVDSQGAIYLVYSALMEAADDGERNYRQLVARKSADGGLTWSPPTIVTPWETHEYEESVFPSVCYGNGRLHIWYMMDNIPGLFTYNQQLGVQSENAENQIRYMSIDTADVGNELQLIGIAENDESTTAFIGGKIYPNPAKEYVMVEMPQTMLDKTVVVEIYSLDGRKVVSRLMEKDVLNIDLRTLKEGVYLVKMMSDTTIFTDKLVIR